MDGVRLVVATLYPETLCLMDAKSHMLEGIACLGNGVWETALGHFDRAVALRENGAWRENVESAWMLAAAWINRSGALRMLGRSEDAIDSLDHAIQAMSHVPLDAHSGYVDRLILAWLNRATCCGECGRRDQAMDGFSHAEEWIARCSPTSGRKLLASMLHANRARVLIDLGQAREAWQDSRTALEVLSDLEPEGEVNEVAIKARGIHCRALAMLLDEPGGVLVESDWIARATDAVEEALTLVRSSRYRGQWVADLVRYGAKIYRVCQPHFLGEFIHEWTSAGGPLADNEALKRDMANELLLAKADLERRIRRQSWDSEYVGRELKILATLQQAEVELGAFLKIRVADPGKNQISLEFVASESH